MLYCQANPNLFFASKTNSIPNLLQVIFVSGQEQGSGNIPFRTLTSCRIGSLSELDSGQAVSSALFPLLNISRHLAHPST
jgi:hypothetical protein